MVSRGSESPGFFHKVLVMVFVFEDNNDAMLEEQYGLQALLKGSLGRLHSWRYGVVSDIGSEVPVGSIGFVQSVLGRQLYPIEVPVCLRKPEFLNRVYCIVGYQDLPVSGNWFIKDATELKAFQPFVMQGCDIKANLESLHTSFNFDECREVVDGSYRQHSYVVSEPVVFRSEWRVLVCDGDVVACLCYMGDTLAFPDAKMVRAMVGILAGESGFPAAYTLDVGVSARGCHLLEMHNFVSCGTYGYIGADLVWMYQKGFWYELGGGYYGEVNKGAGDSVM